MQQAIRAMNQSIGRVIRHMQDYGAVYLCDQRFEQNQLKSQISDWILPTLKAYDNYAELQAKTSEFFSKWQTYQKQASNPLKALSLKLEMENSKNGAQNIGFQAHLYKESKSKKRFGQQMADVSENSNNSCFGMNENSNSLGPKEESGGLNAKIMPKFFQKFQQAQEQQSRSDACHNNQSFTTQSTELNGASFAQVPSNAQAI